MAEYRFILVNTKNHKEESVQMSVDTPYNARKYACWWIRGKGDIVRGLSPYFVQIERVYGSEDYQYFDTIFLKDGKYTRDSGKAINPDTGRPIAVKKKSNLPFGL